MKILLAVVLLSTFALASDPPPQAPKPGDLTVAPADTDTMTQADRDGIEYVDLIADENDVLRKLARLLNGVHTCALESGAKLSESIYDKCASKYFEDIDSITGELKTIQDRQDVLAKRLGLDK